MLASRSPVGRRVGVFEIGEQPGLPAPSNLPSLLLPLALKTWFNIISFGKNVESGADSGSWPSMENGHRDKI